MSLRWLRETLNVSVYSKDCFDRMWFLFSIPGFVYVIVTLELIVREDLWSL